MSRKSTKKETRRKRQRNSLRRSKAPRSSKRARSTVSPTESEWYDIAAGGGLTGEQSLGLRNKDSITNCIHIILIYSFSSQGTAPRRRSRRPQALRRSRRHPDRLSRYDASLGTSIPRWCGCAQTSFGTDPSGETTGASCVWRCYCGAHLFPGRVYAYGTQHAGE